MWAREFVDDIGFFQVAVVAVHVVFHHQIADFLALVIDAKVDSGLFICGFDVAVNDLLDGPFVHLIRWRHLVLVIECYCVWLGLILLKLFRPIAALISASMLLLEYPLLTMVCLHRWSS